MLYSFGRCSVVLGVHPSTATLDKLAAHRMQKGVVLACLLSSLLLFSRTDVLVFQNRPPITHWTNEHDALPSVYGGHDSVSPNKKQNIDNVGPPNAAGTAMDKDLTTRGQMLVQKLEDTSWAEADDSPNAR